ncbi:sulfur reduction protein DsrE [Echinicola marina]|uniref:sulfur reduction protein DsrE n=1 Tax=Echinicola marina TaxID=2859768 RepID=UPI001CF67A37|nr:sulfur reduction protein DsrE [Echinicola marina]UCS91695.1 sulfur reduction protein DsrE [Echinicola marina]
MKNPLKSLLLFLILTVWGITSAHAQNTHSDAKFDYVVLTKKIAQLQPILMAAESLSKESSFGSFEVIICGKEVVELKDHHKMKAYIDKANELGVKLNACGFSLKKFGVAPEEVSLNIVDNGILYNLKLQQKGFISLEL